MSPWTPGCLKPWDKCPRHVCSRCVLADQTRPCTHHQWSPPKHSGKFWLFNHICPLKIWFLKTLKQKRLSARYCLWASEHILFVCAPYRRHDGRGCCRSSCRCHWACPPPPWVCCDGRGSWSTQCHWSRWSPRHTAPAPHGPSPSESEPPA